MKYITLLLFAALWLAPLPIAQHQPIQVYIQTPPNGQTRNEVTPAALPLALKFFQRHTKR